MGEIAGAALVGHVPTLMLAEEVRVRLGGGEDTSLVAGMHALRAELDRAEPDTLVIVDTHWFTTTEHIVAGQVHHRGSYTSEELPKVIRHLPYDYAGAPELAARTEAMGRARGMRVLNATADDIAHHYPTLNLVHYLHRGERVLSVGICQTADADDYLELGALLADAVAEGDERVVVLASGGMSHRFWPLREILQHTAYGPEHVITREARAFDERLVEHLEAGRHTAVIDAWPAYRELAPEGRFGHYLTMAGALGGRAWTSPGRRLSRYESSYGTGQVHIWFDNGRTAST